ncbi:hypothetical protein C8F01DRAFT_1238460 [Mycena amicta]|nr:hypothetical protein C8F01DRAFT_1238460 [Mycena amicta]
MLHDSIADRRRSIDERISSLLLELYQLREERNTLAPIDRLPTEVILAIFDLLAKPSLPEMMTVCRRWHSIIVSNPALWAHIHGYDWALEWLLGARKLSGDRILSLKLDSLESILTPASRTFMEQLAPGLQHLDISVNLIHMPSVHSLALDTAGALTAIPPQFSLLSLTRLHLVYSYPQTPGSLLSVLRAAPNLRSLTLHHGLTTQEVSPMPFTPLQAVHLSALEQLSLAAESFLVEPLLDNISFPPTTRLLVSTGGLFANRSDWTMFLAFVRRHSSAHGAPSIDTLRIRTSTSESRYHHTYTLDLTSNDSQHCVVSLAFLPDVAALGGIVRAILAIFVDFPISRLEVDTAPTLSQIVWQDIFSTIQPLKEVWLHPDANGAAFCRMLLRREHSAVKRLQSILIDIDSEPGQPPVEDDFFSAMVDLLTVYEAATAKPLPSVILRGDLGEKSRLEDTLRRLAHEHGTFVESLIGVLDWESSE